jgi:hypothetical protein
MTREQRDAQYRRSSGRRGRSSSSNPNGEPPQQTAKSQRRQVEESKNERRQLEKERQELRRQLPGLDSLLTFFLAAGVRVELGRGRCLWINGAKAEPLTHLPPPETLEWNSIVSEIALKYLRTKFIRAIQDNVRIDEGVRVVLLAREKGFAIMRGDVRLATIHAARAQIPHREGIRANFLIPGAHWRLLADVLHGAEGELVAEWKRQEEAAKAAAVAADVGVKAKLTRAAARRIDHLPDGLDPELVNACLHASRRIRLERQVAYERPLVLESEVGELTLLPVARTGSRLLMPFRLSKGMETLTGDLVIGDCDPLPLLIGEAVADEDAITAWACALLGFADATCVELEQPAPATRRDPATPQPRPRSPVARSGSTRTLPRGRPWPSYLEPVGHWIRYRGSFVAGHRRHLQDRQRASDEAHDRARQVGIILHPHETWVRPHARGVPDGIEMRFVWHPPVRLKLSDIRTRSREPHTAG